MFADFQSELEAQKVLAGKKTVLSVFLVRNLSVDISLIRCVTTCSILAEACICGVPISSSA